MATSSSQHREFGPFRLDRAARLLLRKGEPVALAPKTFDVLALLVENPGRAISKAELLAALWPDTAVEGNLAFQISTLRTALGPEGSKWVQTVARHGYRFLAPQILSPRGLHRSPLGPAGTSSVRRSSHPQPSAAAAP